MAFTTDRRREILTYKVTLLGLLLAVSFICGFVSAAHHN